MTTKIVQRHPHKTPVQIRGLTMLSAPRDTTCTDADTYYKIAGTDWTTCCTGYNKYFTGTTAGVLTYTGPKGPHLSFDGSSDLSVDTALETTITYALFKNGAVTNATTPQGFDALNQSENIAITGAVEPEKNDTYEVYVKSSRAGVVVTSKTLAIRITGNTLL